MPEKTIPEKAICKLCGLPLEVATMALPIVAGLAAGTMVGCVGRCGPIRRVVRGVLAGGLTAAGTFGLRALSTHYCQCPET